MNIHEILKMTEEEYQMILMDWWLTYCTSKCLSNATYLQLLLTNNALYNWWYSQLEPIEEEFIEDATPYENKYTKEDVKALYKKHVYKLQKYYNSDLLKEALSKKH